MGKFYKLIVKQDVRRAPETILGFPVSKELSTYIETERDLVAEFEKRGVKSVDITTVDSIPERGEDGNFPRVFDLKDEGLTQEVDDDENDEEDE